MTGERPEALDTTDRLLRALAVEKGRNLRLEGEAKAALAAREDIQVAARESAALLKRRATALEFRLSEARNALGDREKQIATLEREMSDLRQRHGDRMTAAEQQLAELGTLAEALREELAEVQLELSIQKDRLLEAGQVLSLARKVAGSWPVRATTALPGPTGRAARALARRLDGWRPALGTDDLNCVFRLDSNALVVGPFGAACRSDPVIDLFDNHRQDPYQRADSLARLCALSDLDFVRCAYVTLLGRQPDPEGEAFYVARIRAGAAKLAIVNALRRSDEGRRHDPGIAGLDRALRRHRGANRPLVGWLFRLFSGIEGDSPTLRRLRAFENNFELERDRATARFSLVHHYLVSLQHQTDALHGLTRKALRGSPLRDLTSAEARSHDGWEAAIRSSLND